MGVILQLRLTDVQANDLANYAMAHSYPSPRAWTEDERRQAMRWALARMSQVNASGGTPQP